MKTVPMQFDCKVKFHLSANFVVEHLSGFRGQKWTDFVKFEIFRKILGERIVSLSRGGKNKESECIETRVNASP